jgi:hypothetical protein
MTISEQTIVNRFGLFIAGLVFAGALVSYATGAAFAQNKFPIGTYSSGEFIVTFAADGNHSFAMNGEVMVKGAYVIKDNVIELTDLEGQFACSGVTGKYKWKAQEKSLSFEKVADECEGRAGALAQTWTKK